MINGIINVYKEKGFTSHDVVAKLRGILKQRKIGHTGTLDPDAEGVLPVCLGYATKLCDTLTDESKEYIAQMLLGVTTDTLDMSGTVLKRREILSGEDEIIKAVNSFIGEYDQIPPMYSALKVNGKKLYELARAGQNIERKARRVHIFSIEILEIKVPVVTMRIICSKGTYIRSLCEDIGESLGCGGAMQSLVRSRVGKFELREARKLTEIEQARDEGNLTQLVEKVETMFSKLSFITVKKECQRLVENGNVLTTEALLKVANAIDDEQVRVYSEEGRFFGVYAYHKKYDIWKPVKMFLEQEEI